MGPDDRQSVQRTDGVCSYGYLAGFLLHNKEGNIHVQEHTVVPIKKQESAKMGIPENLPTAAGAGFERVYPPLFLRHYVRADRPAPS